MTIKEAIDWCEQFIDNIVFANINGKKRVLGLQAMQVCKSALEKQIPKKPRVDSESWLCCPKCDETFAMFDMLNRRLLCCGCCGQKLDWSEVDAKKRSDTE